jgi:hypothetical protein
MGLSVCGIMAVLSFGLWSLGSGMLNLYLEFLLINCYHKDKSSCEVSLCARSPYMQALGLTWKHVFSGSGPLITSSLPLPAILLFSDSH